MMNANTNDVRPFYLAGKWTEGEHHVEIRAPYDDSLVARVSMGERKHAEEAIAAAVRAFEVTRKLSSYDRQQALLTMRKLLEERKEEFARTVSREVGKPMKTARGEVERALFVLDIAAEETTRINGEVLPLDLLESTRGRWGMVRRFPVGPLTAITPFNFPINLVVHKVASAMAAGCPVVVKPAPQAPVSSILPAELVEKSGWPAEGVSILPLANEDAALLVEDDRMKMLSFTGSDAVGWELKRRAGKKRVTLELGGNATCIIHSDADLEYAAARCVLGGFAYAGQSCISVQRILVQRSVYGKFLEYLVPGVQALKVGDPSDDATDVGPMIREADAKRAESWIQEAAAAGAEILCGGHRKGAVLEPTVLTHTQPTQRVNCAEAFAPLVTVEPYDEFDEALRRVNDSPYGLQSGVFTRDVQRIFQAYETLEVGGVIIGEVPTFRIDHMPYGGVKNSGMGREGLRYAIEEMTERKLLVMNLR